MVGDKKMKYIILACSNDKTFDIPRQLVEINGEKLVARTIRLLKKNGVEDIIITAKDERFDNLGATRYEPKINTFDYIKRTGYWLDAFPFELMNEPICFIWGDVYFSENAIKTIVETPTDGTLFFCTYNNDDPKYIKHHDEPFAYKIVDTELFKKHVDKVKKLYDEGKTCRHPIVWEVYRSINGIDINEHIMTKGFVAINDISCDIDSMNDLEELEARLGGDKMVKCEVVKEFTLERFNELKNIQRKKFDTKGKLYVGDTFECDKKMADYLMGDNKDKQVVVKVIEVKPIKVKKELVKSLEEVPEEDALSQEITESYLNDESIKPKKKKSSKK